ncbi:MAG: cytochrome D1 domain-containing protein [Acidobacteriota bacterium]|nr:cytochrome D1 domain-containing protein [Acidobacteriota bacterium]
MTMPFVIRWRPTFGVLAGAAALALYQSAASSQQPGAPAGRIAIASKAPGALTVVGLQGQPPREFKVGYLPHEVAAAGSLVFVSNYGNAHVRSSDLTDNPGNTLSVVDLSRLDAAAQAIDLGPGRCAPHGLSVSRDQQRLYVTCEGRQDVLVVDVPSRRILHAIPTNQAGSHMLAVSADGSRAYVTNFWPGTVSVLDLRARRILAQIATGSGTEGIGLSPDDRYAYTSSVYVNEIVKIDTGTLQVVGRAKMGNCLGAVRVVPTPVDGSTLVVNCADNSRVLLVDASTLNVRHEIPVGTMPIGIAVPDDRFAFAANMGDDTISVIDIRRGIVVGTIPAGDDPDGIVFLPG